MDWIKVEDRLPEELGEYLLWYEASNEKGFIKGYYTAMGQFQSFWTIGNEMDFITHWAEIEPPKD